MTKILTISEAQNLQSGDIILLTFPFKVQRIIKHKNIIHLILTRDGNDHICYAYYDEKFEVIYRENQNYIDPSEAPLFE